MLSLSYVTRGSHNITLVSYGLSVISEAMWSPRWPTYILKCLYVAHLCRQLQYYGKTKVHSQHINNKIRNLLTEYAAVMLYKHMILPFMQYAGFMLLPCNIDDRNELQKRQNDALRLCTKIRVSDHVKIVDLHARCNIISLEQRRRIQSLRWQDNYPPDNYPLGPLPL